MRSALFAALLLAGVVAAPEVASADGSHLRISNEVAAPTPPPGLQLTLSADYLLITGGVQAGLRYRYLEVDAGARFFLWDDEEYVGLKGILLPDDAVSPYLFVRGGDYHAGAVFEQAGYDSRYVGVGAGIEVNLGRHAYLMAEVGEDRLLDAPDEFNTKELEVGIGLGLRIF